VRIPTILVDLHAESVLGCRQDVLVLADPSLNQITKNVVTNALD